MRYSDDDDYDQEQELTPWEQYEETQRRAQAKNAIEEVLVDAFVRIEGEFVDHANARLAHLSKRLHDLIDDLEDTCESTISRSFGTASSWQAAVLADAYITPSVAAWYLSCSTSKVYSLIATGAISCCKVGRLLKIRARTVLEFAEAQQVVLAPATESA